MKFPPSTSLAILLDLFLRNPLVVCYIWDPGFYFRAGFILAGLSLVVGYQVVQWLVEESEEQRGNSNFLLLGTRKDVIPVEVDCCNTQKNSSSYLSYLYTN